MKSFLFLSIGLFLTIFLFSCKPGLFSLGGYDYEIVMPTVELTNSPKTLAYAYIGVEGNTLFTPQANTDDPRLEALIGLSTTEQPTFVRSLVVYSVSVKDMAQEADPQIITDLSIPLGTRPVKIIRGPDLDAKFSLFYNNGRTLIIRPKQALPIPLPEDDLLKVPRIKGVVARVVCETEPIDLSDIILIREETTGICKFPIQVVATGDPLQINQVDLVVKAPNFLWLSPGNLFPNTIIERDSNQALVAPQDGLEFLVQNVTVNSEIEILAPPENMSLPGVDFFLVNKLGEIDLSFGEKSFTLKLPGDTLQKDQPRLMPSAWGKIKSN